MGLCDLYVRDKMTGTVHKVGTDKHDALTVWSNGVVVYENLQNGDGTGSDPEHDGYGYEFINTEYGCIPEYANEEEYADFIEYVESLPERKRQRKENIWEYIHHIKYEGFKDEYDHFKFEIIADYIADLERQLEELQNE